VASIFGLNVQILLVFKMLAVEQFEQQFEQQSESLKVTLNYRLRKQIVRYSIITNLLPKLLHGDNNYSASFFKTPFIFLTFKSSSSLFTLPF
jgi:hypothetical protein